MSAGSGTSNSKDGGSSATTVGDVAAQQQQTSSALADAGSVAEAMHSNDSDSAASEMKTQQASSAAAVNAANDTDLPWHRLDATSHHPLSPANCHVRFSTCEHHSPSLEGRANQMYTDDGRRIVCGCVAFRVDADEHGVARLSILLVQSARKTDYIFPKGGCERFETFAECAQRELREEGGVEGEVLAELPPVDFESKKSLEKRSRMRPFLIRARTHHAHYAEEATRKRRWVEWTQVDALMTRPETKTVWNDAKAALRAHGCIDANGCAVFKPDAAAANNHPQATE